MRLIDADKMLAEVKGVAYDGGENAVTYTDILNVLRNWVCRQPTVEAYGKWVRVEDRLPKLPDCECCSVTVITYRIGDANTHPMIYERATVRGINITRWKLLRNRLADYIPDYWMPLPEPPEKRYKCRYADDNGVCSKCSGNGEIIYCVEGPCPYMFEEARDDGKNKLD